MLCCITLSLLFFATITILTIMVIVILCCAESILPHVSLEFTRAQILLSLAMLAGVSYISKVGLDIKLSDKQPFTSATI